MDVDPVDFSSDVGRVRALIPDVDKVIIDDSPDPKYIFSDVHLQSFLSLYTFDEDPPSVHVTRAAADAVEALAASEAYVS